MLNLLAAESLILTHLRSELDVLNLARIDAASTLTGLTSLSSVIPGVFLQPGEGRPVGGDPSYAQAEDQEWELIILVPTIDPAATESPTALAGRIMARCLNALIGWRPAAGFGLMQWTGRPAPHFDARGYAEFPLTFTTRQLLEGSNGY